MWIKNHVKKICEKKKEEFLLQNASKLEITDLKNLCFGINNIPSVDFVATNASYGHAYHLKQYAGIDINAGLNCTITHGMNITSWSACEVEVSHLVNIILTYSEYCKKIIENVTNMNAVPIGPMIAYAQKYCTDEELKKRKKENGRTLLVFPTHGISDANIVYDVELFCKEINSIGKAFDTIMVCLHFADVKAGLDKVYRKKGYKVVCAGVGTDVNFLNRQRMILELSDAVMGNSFTTGLAYALYLNKPVYVFGQEIKFDNKSSNNFTQLHIDNSLATEFYELSSDKSFGNLEKQKQWGNYYFGFDKVKSKEELSELLNSLMRK